ncbi:siderophore-interacting protein [Planctomonas sp. JC2975]|uniref:siderophore-interacting protein n=1 Tax=Planctomonas sp. JC2975 TaxID=2729626 RepID=UPI0014744099|nr:siderophore-interacting protein [Planctomonas sp. JC2975]NNC13096.1 siderophore-interacting protein [Planctomonas sp. JC2975]
MSLVDTQADQATLDGAAEPLYRLFDATVLATERISPTFVRITFGGRGLDDLAWDGLDQRIKLLLPNAQGGYPSMRAKDPAWYAQWSALPDETRPPMRTYTIRDRRVGFAGVELDVDFALHAETAGPAAGWAAGAEAGMPLRLLGPNVRADGDRGAIGWIPPTTTRRFVIAGDETALPAMASILKSLPTDAATTVFAELPHRADLEALDAPTSVDVRFVARYGDPGESLADAVCAAFPRPTEPSPDTADVSSSVPAMPAGVEPEDVDIEAETLWEVPGTDPLTGGRITGDDRHASTYVWLAGEAAAIKRIRRHLVRDVGFDRQAVSFMGYWRRGRSEY